MIKQRTRQSGLVLAASAIAIALSLTGGAMAQQGGGLNLIWNTADDGGVTFSTGGGYTLGGTAGQPDAGQHTRAGYRLEGGFWHGLANVDTYKEGELYVDADDSGVASPGDTLLYTVHISNSAVLAAATGVYLSDTPDPNTAFLVGSVTTSKGTVVVGNGSGDTTVGVDVGTVLGGEDVVVTYQVTINDPLPPGVGSVRNQAVVTMNDLGTSRTDDPGTPPEDDPTVLLVGVGVQVTDWHDPLCAGWNQRYTIEVINDSDQDLTHVRVVDTLPDERLYLLLDESSPGAIPELATYSVSWEIDSIPAGTTHTLYLEIRPWSSVADGTLFKNCVRVESDQMPPFQNCAVTLMQQCAPPPPPTATATATATATPTATPSPMPNPLQQCFYSGMGYDLIYRIDAAEFSGYAGNTASNYALIAVTSPPAPAGWNQHAFTPDGSWETAEEVWWDAWYTGAWSLRPIGSGIIGIERGGSDEGKDGTTHLTRRILSLTPPGPGWNISRAVLAMWSDNKTAWHWNGVLVKDDAQVYIGEVELYPDHVDAGGGIYTLAIQNSNDYMLIENPQGTAYSVCVTWEYSVSPLPPGPARRQTLPLIWNSGTMQQHTLLVGSVSSAPGASGRR